MVYMLSEKMKTDVDSYIRKKSAQQQEQSELFQSQVSDKPFGSPDKKNKTHPKLCRLNHRMQASYIVGRVLKMRDSAY